MFTMLITPAWWLAKLAIGRGLVTGPFASAIGITTVAVSVVVTGALIFAWIRDDAATDAQAQCNTERLEAELAAERARNQSLSKAAADAAIEASLRRQEKETADAAVDRLTREKGELRDEVRHLKDSVDLVFRADDAWMRGRRAKGTPSAGGR